MKFEEVKSLPTIEVKDLTKVFGKNNKQAIKLLEQGQSKEAILKETDCTVGVNRASFSVEAGEIFVIMGLSGSGKSTLVRLINRLIEPTMGSILIDGEDLAKMDKTSLRNVRREKLSMVFQQFALFPHRTILQNAEYGLEIQNVPKSERTKRATEALELVGLGNYIHQKPSQLSGGMQQRVGLARALANDPKVLLMDEALRLGDRIAIMKDGVIVQIGTPEEILVNPVNTYVERFVEDVDRSKVLMAQNIMKRPEAIFIEKHGPRVALERMRESGISSIFVIDNKRNLIGYVTADDALKAVKNNINDLKEIIRTDGPTVGKETALNDIFSIIYDSPIPVTVVEDGKLVGIIVRGTVIGALAGESEVNLTNA